LASSSCRCRRPEQKTGAEKIKLLRVTWRTCILMTTYCRWCSDKTLHIHSNHSFHTLDQLYLKCNTIIKNSENYNLMCWSGAHSKWPPRAFILAHQHSRFCFYAERYARVYSEQFNKTVMKLLHSLFQFPVSCCYVILNTIITT